MSEIKLKPQALLILSYLEEHGSATVQEANRAGRTTEARKRVSEMIAAGVPIRKEWIMVAVDGEPRRVMRYHLEVNNNDKV